MTLKQEIRLLFETNKDKFIQNYYDELKDKLKLSRAEKFVFRYIRLNSKKLGVKI